MDETLPAVKWKVPQASNPHYQKFQYSEMTSGTYGCGKKDTKNIRLQCKELESWTLFMGDVEPSMLFDRDYILDDNTNTECYRIGFTMWECY